jgi:hypothetical protein
MSEADGVISTPRTRAPAPDAFPDRTPLLAKFATATAALIGGRA